jgi:hypothetical protein
MTTSAIASIDKYVMIKGSASGKCAFNQGVEKKSLRISDGGSPRDRSDRHLLQGASYEKSIQQDQQTESRIARQNRVALTLRDTDHSMQQIGSQINHMQDALNTMVQQYPPCPPGSEEKNSVLEKVNAFRKQIERLTFASLEDDNAGNRPAPTPSPFGLKSGTLIMEAIEDGGDSYSVRRIVGEYGSTENTVPQLARDAKDSEIKASIVQLEKTGAFLRHQRDQLKSDTRFLFNMKKSRVGIQEAEFKSLFIGKHLSHRPDSDLTTTPSLLTGYLN